MIPFDWIYCRPNSLKEAADLYRELQAEGKTVIYYAGGSEIITMSRAGSIRPDAIIDLKKIPECTALTGICSHPFQSKEMDSVLNDRSVPCEIRAKRAAELLPEPAYEDAEGSGSYRMFVLENTLCTLLENWENGKI